MARRGRPCVVGVVALVAGLAAISLLATHASADACATVDCGSVASCTPYDDGSTECLCDGGYVFNVTDKTCNDPCADVAVQCPVRAECVARRGKAECECEMGYILQNNTCTDGLVQTQVEVEGLSYLALVTFDSPVPMAHATGAIACSDVGDLGGGSSTKITVEWKSFGVDTVGTGMCKSLSFHADPGCADKGGLTIARPAMVGGAFPVTKRTVRATPPQSISCEIATCHKECGTAQCVVRDGTSQCKCPWSQVFDEAQKRCSSKSPSTTPDPNPSGGADPCEAVKCARNSQCVGRNGQPTCECDAGYTKANKGLCSAMCKPDCPANGQCVVVEGKPVCRCKAGFRQDKSKCTPVCKPACGANAQCMAVKGKPACECKTGFKSVNNKCMPVCKPACTANSQCMAVKGKPACQCSTGFKSVDNKCMPVCKPGCGANAQCMAVKGKPACQCSTGFQLVNNKCTRR